MVKRERDGAEGFGPYLLQLRLNRGLSQEALAKRSGITHPHYSKIETGKRVPQYDTVEKLIEGLEPMDPQTRDRIYWEAGFRPPGMPFPRFSRVVRLQQILEDPFFRGSLRDEILPALDQLLEHAENHIRSLKIRKARTIIIRRNTDERTRRDGEGDGGDPGPTSHPDHRRDAPPPPENFSRVRGTGGDEGHPSALSLHGLQRGTGHGQAPHGPGIRGADGGGDRGQ